MSTPTLPDSTHGPAPIRPAGPAAWTAGVAPISLEELDATAALQTRVERKYLVPHEVLERLLGDFSDRLRVLQIDGRREFGYRSVYFDTEDLLFFHQHLQGRRHRYKVRTRTYLDTGLCRLEVKGKGPRGETVKEHVSHDRDRASVLTPAARQFIGRTVAESALVNALAPVLDTHYRRTTFLDTTSGSRVTCDAGLLFSRAGQEVPSAGRAVLVETKSERGTGPIDRWLWQHHVRPQSVSKYCVGTALLHPGLRANPWHRLLRAHFTPGPAAPGPAAPGPGAPGRGRSGPAQWRPHGSGSPVRSQ